MSTSERRAIFLDRDGTLIEDPGYLDDPNRVRVLPGVARALRSLAAKGFALVVISNQSGVGRGLFTAERLQEVHRRMVELLELEGVALDGVWYCTHAPEASCLCRKPQPGMLLAARDQLGVSLDQSWMIGDKDTDAEAGRAAGCKTIVLGTETPDLSAAAELILNA